MTNIETKQFDTGAVRSKDADDVRFDLITPIGLRKIAERYALGAKKYGDNNWLKGIPASDLVNHGLRHLNLWLAGDKSDEHLAGVLWNFLTLAHFAETRPELMDIPAIQQKLEVNKEDRFKCVSAYGAELNFTRSQVTRYEGKANIYINGIHYYLQQVDIQRFKEWYGEE